jgi:hypothetical protein
MEQGKNVPVYTRHIPAAFGMIENIHHTAMESAISGKSALNGYLQVFIGDM